MRRAHISDLDDVVLDLAAEIRRSAESRYDHRLHGVLLVARGMSCTEVARLLGDAPRTVAYWVRRFEEEGLAGLGEGSRPGRPRRLSKAQLEEISFALSSSPMDFQLGVKLWDGKTLSEFVAREWGITLGLRQSRRLVSQLGFGPRNQRPEPAPASPKVRGKEKKPSSPRPRRNAVGLKRTSNT
jgi:transposase